MRSPRRDPHPLLATGVLEAVVRGDAPLPPRAYLDEAVWALEQDELFHRGWSCVALEQDVALPGQLVRTPSGLVVVRGADLELRAFHDVCQHRGAALIGEPCSRRVAELTCPYHGFRYDLAGQLVSAPSADDEPGFDRRALALSPASVATWKGLVFAHDAVVPEASLAVTLADPPEALDRIHLRALRRRISSRYDVEANWKLVVENFLESHHVPTVHPALARLCPIARASTLPPTARFLGGTMPLGDGVETVSEDGTRRGRASLPGASADDERVVTEIAVLPSLLVSLQPDYALFYRLYPTAPGRTCIQFDVCFHPSVQEADTHDVAAFWARGNDEDARVCALQQRGVASRGFRGGVLFPADEGGRAFQRRIAELHLRSRA